MRKDVWMSSGEIDLVLKNLDGNKSMLEWGCGGSTLYFSEFVKDYHSIEHNKDWYIKVKREIEDKSIKNIYLYYVPIGEIPKEYNQSTYDVYSKYIDYPDIISKTYDVVLIDGRARRLCALKIIPYLNPESTVIIHDYYPRPQYHCVTNYYDLVDEIKTNQSIATFKLKDNYKNIDGYKMSLGTFDRL